MILESSSILESLFSLEYYSQMIMKTYQIAFQLIEVILSWKDSELVKDLYQIQHFLILVAFALCISEDLDTSSLFPLHSYL